MKPPRVIPNAFDVSGNVTFDNDTIFGNSSISPEDSLPTVPSPRFGHSAVVYKVNNYMYVCIYVHTYMQMCV